MNCCVECFLDTQIRTMIATNNEKGDCDFCGQRNVFIYSIERQPELSDLIGEVISVYEEDTEGEPLFNSIINDWNIFNKEVPSSETLLKAFCNLALGEQKGKYNVNASIPHEHREQYGIFSGHSWGEFSFVIREKNRFCNSFFKADQFSSFLTYAITKYTKGTIFYRARICNNKQGYRSSEMGPPPQGKRKPGRVNPEGIVVLYLASDEITALNEVRASAFDFVSIGEFRLIKDINVVNISGLNKISPALYSSGLESLAANIKIFGDIANEIAKPLRRNDSPLEYLPTQYITEFIKSKGYSGVGYTSTMRTDGMNIAVFDDSLFECIDVHNVEIKKLNYQYEQLK